MAETPDPDGYVDSMCSIWARLAIDALEQDDPDIDAAITMLEYVEQYGQTVGYEPGETPDHLEEHLFDGD